MCQCPFRHWIALLDEAGRTQTAWSLLADKALPAPIEDSVPEGIRDIERVPEGRGRSVLPPGP